MNLWTGGMLLLYNELDRKNIENSLQILKEIFGKNDFNFYFSEGNKIYRKNSQGVKRIKDIRNWSREH